MSTLTLTHTVAPAAAVTYVKMLTSTVSIVSILICQQLLSVDVMSVFNAIYRTAVGLLIDYSTCKETLSHITA